MKRLVKEALRMAGWELNRVGTADRSPTRTRATMKEGLNWLSTHELPVRTVLDVGASDGRWSKECMAFFPEAKYLLFEPQPAHREALDHFSRSHKDKVTVIRKAVGDFEGQTYFDASDPLGGAIAKRGEGLYTITVDVTSIDAWLSPSSHSGPFLIKLDTHGFEQHILKGASRTLENTSVLVIEAYNYRIRDEALLFWELCEFLFERGFRPIDLVDVLHREYDNSLWQVDLFFVRSTWKGFDHIQYR